MLCDKEPEQEPMSHSYYTNLITGEIFKFDGVIIDHEDEIAAKKYRSVYRVEKIGSELTKDEEYENYAMVRNAKMRELVGIMKYDAMR